MKARGIDPRYTTWEEDDPAYRVDFWEGSAICDEWLVEEAADVAEVLDWARREAQGRDIVVYVQTTDNGRPGLVRLLGREPDWTRAGELPLP